MENTADKGLVPMEDATEEDMESMEEVLASFSKLRKFLEKTEGEKDVSLNSEKLLKLYREFSSSHQFRAGDLVKWKSGLKNKKYPEYGEVAVVIDCLAEPMRDLSEKGSGSPYFNEPLDLVLGLLDADGDFMTFYYDARRFEPYESIAVDGAGSAER